MRTERKREISPLSFLHITTRMSSAPSPLPAPPSDYFASLLLSPPPLNSFDAFSKTQATYKERTTRGGLLTVLVGIIVGLLVWYEAREYLFGEANYEFSVDRGLGTTLQLNFDATVATPCHCASSYPLT